MSKRGAPAGKQSLRSMLASTARPQKKQEDVSLWISEARELEHGVGTADARKRHCSSGAGVCAAGFVEDTHTIDFSSNTDDPEDGGGMGAINAKDALGTVYMTPRTFLSLAAPLNTSKPEAKEKLGRIVAGLHSKYAMGPPTLWLKRTDTAGLFAVTMHEGRHRMVVVVDELGPDCLVPVQLAGGAGVSLRDITALRNESGTSARPFSDIAIFPQRPLGGYYRLRVSARGNPQIL